MQNAETVLGVLRDRGRRGLPCDELYRQMFNAQLFQHAYGRIYSNQGAMTPGACGETADGMSMAKIGSNAPPGKLRTAAIAYQAAIDDIIHDGRLAA
jgi:hypothetical protein